MTNLARLKKQGRIEIQMNSQTIKSQNALIIESQGLEGTSGDHLIQLPAEVCSRQ